MHVDLCVCINPHLWVCVCNIKRIRNADGGRTQCMSDWVQKIKLNMCHYDYKISIFFAYFCLAWVICHQLCKGQECVLYIYCPLGQSFPTWSPKIVIFINKPCTCCASHAALFQYCWTVTINTTRCVSVVILAILHLLCRLCWSCTVQLTLQLYSTHGFKAAEMTPQLNARMQIQRWYLYFSLHTSFLLKTRATKY